MADSSINLDVEVWRVVPSLPQIEASSFGRIRRKSKVRKPSAGTFGSVRRASKGAHDAIPQPPKDS